MKKLITPIIFALGLLTLAPSGHAEVVEYVRICSLFGSAFHYISGTDICVNEETGETRQVTEGGVWFSILPTNNQGHWVTNPQAECGTGRLLKVSTVKASDFTPNIYGKFQVTPVGFKLLAGQFISRVMFSGGFVDPLQPLAANPRLSPEQFCLRVADPDYVISELGSPAQHLPFCTNAPLGCVSNQQIVGTQAAYSFPVLGSPMVHYNTDANGRQVGAPTACGTQLVLTTGMSNYDPRTVNDASRGNIPIPAGGSVTTWVCIEQGSPALVPDAR